jgi:hypothetical protein
MTRSRVLRCTLAARPCPLQLEKPPRTSKEMLGELIANTDQSVEKQINDPKVSENPREERRSWLQLRVQGITARSRD